jgi:hypothetical protein
MLVKLKQHGVKDTMIFHIFNIFLLQRILPNFTYMLENEIKYKCLSRWISL